MRAPTLSPASPLSLDEARRRLRDLGYLSGSVERYVFRRAFAGRGGLFLPAIFFGAFAAAVASLGAVETAEAGFGDSLTAVAALLVHLFFADLAIAGILAVLLAAIADHSRSPAGTATASGLAAAAAVFFLWIAGAWSLSRDLPARALLWGAPVALAALILARGVRSGFLARAYAHSRVLPGRPRRRVFFVAAVAGVLIAAGDLLFLFVAQPPGRAPGAPLAARRRGRRRRRGRPGAGRLRLGWPLRASRASRDRSDRLVARAGAAPPEIWSDLATGEPPARHGVRALARVRPRGSPAGTAPSARDGVVPAPSRSACCGSSSTRRSRPRIGAASHSGRSPLRPVCPPSRWDGGLPVPGRAPMSSETRRSWRAPRTGSPPTAGRSMLSGSPARRTAGRDGVSPGPGHPAGQGRVGRAPEGGRSAASVSRGRGLARRRRAAGARGPRRGQPCRGVRARAHDRFRRAAAGQDSANPPGGCRPLDPRAGGSARRGGPPRAPRRGALFSRHARDDDRCDVRARAPRRRARAPPRPIASTWKS